MSDYLVDIGANKMARQTIKKLGLPVPLPQKLRRIKGPWSERPISDRQVIVCHGPNSKLAPFFAEHLGPAGANIFVDGDEAQVKHYSEHGEACGRLPSTELTDNLRPHGLVFDGTGIETPGDLRGLYNFFHKWVRNLAKCGRVVIVSHPPERAKTPAAAATARAFDGFVRSLAREIGRKGSTANRIVVEPGAEDRLGPVLRFLLSDSSVYVSAQTINVSAVAAAVKNPRFKMPLQGKTALVTGAARGIGASIAKVLAREGAHVICMDRPAEEEAVSVLASKLGGTMLLLDLTDPEAADKIKKLLDDKLDGGLDILVHNAGITRDKTLAKMKEEYWDQALGVNLISLMEVNEALLPVMRDNGRIICLSSVTGFAGNMGQSNYAATKAGIIGYVKALAPFVAEKGITVNAVAPGLIETKMTAAMPKGPREAGRRLSNLFQGGLPEDIAETVTFLATQGAAGITGEAIRICGGSYIGA
ncbi:MAG: 3-oxoacyl-ACP reductase [Deltaproteobacteria bacterium]|nr:3-oxoacyl-ACP reductase [Deltaproteobacteria bacterium]